MAQWNRAYTSNFDPEPTVTSVEDASWDDITNIIDSTTPHAVTDTILDSYQSSDIVSVYIDESSTGGNTIPSDADGIDMIDVSLRGYYSGTANNHLAAYIMSANNTPPATYAEHIDYLETGNTTLYETFLPDDIDLTPAEMLDVADGTDPLYFCVYALGYDNDGYGYVYDLSIRFRWFRRGARMTCV